MDGTKTPTFDDGSHAAFRKARVRSHARLAAARLNACEVIRKRIEEHFGWGKTIGRIRQTFYRGIRRVDQQFKLTMTASNIVRMARMVRMLGAVPKAITT